jgi:hypothetical protein
VALPEEFNVGRHRCSKLATALPEEFNVGRHRCNKLPTLIPFYAKLRPILVGMPKHCSSCNEMVLSDYSTVERCRNSFAGGCWIRGRPHTGTHAHTRTCAHNLCLKDFGRPVHYRKHNLLIREYIAKRCLGKWCVLLSVWHVYLSNFRRHPDDADIVYWNGEPWRCCKDDWYGKPLVYTDCVNIAVISWHRIRDTWWGRSKFVG